ncbi:hypothetical protein LSM04_009252 [Trypanosoma melophagium]|uniref:uncharacterized protein n=1 Tax=Trypanosoma melophagium TaxID=715481 RepID=UPI00351A074D|nr:hypothetical protein LSM04_009252 [Trypanosoma melophagium]
MENGQYMEPTVKPLWDTDLEALLVRKLMEKWIGLLRTETHRYSLCGDKPADLSGKELITGDLLTRPELIHLARARCGGSEFFGRLFWSARDCLPTCRMCNRTPEQSAALSYKNQLTDDTPNHQLSPPQQSPTVNKATVNRREKACPYCGKTYSGFSNLKIHCRKQRSN